MKRIPKQLVDRMPEIKEVWFTLGTDVREYWDFIQSKLTNTLIIPSFQSPQTSLQAHASVQLRLLSEEVQEAFQHHYVINFGIDKKNPKDFNALHELAHIAVGLNGYCYPYQKTNQLSSKDKNTINQVALIYNAAIHPAVDKVLKSENLFTRKVYQQKLDDSLSSLVQISKQGLDLSDFYNCYHLIDARHRLLQKDYDAVLEKVSELGLEDLNSFAKSLPIYDFDTGSPEETLKAIIKTCNHYQIDLVNLPFLQMIDNTFPAFQ